MLISNYSDDLILYVVMIRITALGIIPGLISVPLHLLLDRPEFVNIPGQFKDSLLKEKWLVISQRKPHGIKNDLEFLMLQKKNPGCYQTIPQKKNRKRS